MRRFPSAWWIAGGFTRHRTAISRRTPAPRRRQDRRPTYVRELEERLAGSEERLQQTLEAHRERLQEFDQIRARLDRDVGVRVAGGQGADVPPHSRGGRRDGTSPWRRPSRDGSASENPLTEGLRSDPPQAVRHPPQRRAWRRWNCRENLFDPEVAEAIGVVVVEDPAQHDRVTLVTQAGYRIGERILRPAQVQVGTSRENRKRGRSLTLYLALPGRREAVDDRGIRSSSDPVFSAEVVGLAGLPLQREQRRQHVGGVPSPARPSIALGPLAPGRPVAVLARSWAHTSLSVGG